jgi:hypothetical protein
LRRARVRRSGEGIYAKNSPAAMGDRGGARERVGGIFFNDSNLALRAEITETQRHRETDNMNHEATKKGLVARLRAQKDRFP